MGASQLAQKRRPAKVRMYHLLKAGKYKEAAESESKVICYDSETDSVGEALSEGRVIYTPREAWVASWEQTLLEWTGIAPDTILVEAQDVPSFLRADWDLSVTAGSGPLWLSKNDKTVTYLQLQTVERETGTVLPFKRSEVELMSLFLSLFSH